jgi:hypothetical protein
MADSLSMIDSDTSSAFAGWVVALRTCLRDHAREES